MNAELFKNLAYALSGLGLFLISIKLMSTTLKNMTGKYSAKVMDSFHNNKWISLGFGILFTTMIQSSDGAVALIIGLIAAGIMSLRAAIPFLLGANIGTATTSIIVALGGSGSGWLKFTMYFLFFVFLGATIIMFAKEENKTNLGMLFFAVGSIFLGLEILGLGMKQVAQQDWFESAIKGVGFNSWLSLIVSTILTGIIQSSSATVTIVQTIYGESPSILPLYSAIAMVIGANIGTTFTALIASIGGKSDAKRVGLVWLIANLVMAIILMPFIKYYSELITLIIPSPNINNLGEDAIKTAIRANAMWRLSVSHLMFNSMLVFVFIWLTNQLEWVTHKLIKNDEKYTKYQLSLPVDLIDQSTALAFTVAQTATFKVANMAEDAMELFYTYYKTREKKSYDEFRELIEQIDISRQKLYSYLVEIGSKNMTKEISNKHMSLVLALRSIERIPLLGKDFAKSLNKTLRKNVFAINDIDYENLKKMLKILLVMTKKSAQQIQKFDKKIHEEIQDLYEESLRLSSEYSKEHIQRNEESEFDVILAYKQVTRMTHHCVRVSNYMSHSKRKKQKTSLSDELLVQLDDV